MAAGPMGIAAAMASVEAMGSHDLFPAATVDTPVVGHADMPEAQRAAALAEARGAVAPEVAADFAAVAAVAADVAAADAGKSND